MSDAYLNLYELTDPGDFHCTYRLYTVEGLPKTEELGRNLDQLRRKLIYEIYQPVTIISHGGSHALAIPATGPKPELEQQLTPAVVTLVPRGEYDLSLDTVTSSTRGILTDFVEFFIKSPLRANRDLWSTQGRNFFWKRPVNDRDEKRDVDIFEGFSYNIHHIGDRLYLSLDVTNRYVDRYSLNERLAGSDPTSFKWKNYLYHFGHQLYEVQLVKVLDRGIREFKFPDTNGNTHNIYDYTRDRCAQPWPAYIRNLDPSSPTIAYRYPGNRQERFGAAALCKRIFKTDDPEIYTLHTQSIKKPQDRFTAIRKSLDDAFSRARCGLFDINIGREPLRIPTRSFAVPDHLFGNGKILHVQHHVGDSGIQLSQLGRERLHLLRDGEAGPYTKSPFLPQYIVVPQTLPRQVYDDFKQQFIRKIQQFTTYPGNPTTVLYDDRHASSLRKQKQAILDALSKSGIVNGYALMILPGHADADLHNYLKRELWPQFQFQCAMANKIMGFYDRGGNTIRVKNHLASRYQSYLENVALGLLQVNRKWPWVLEASLHYDAYVGIDVKNHTLGVSFVYQNGKQVIVRSERSQQKEKLLSKMMRTLINEHVATDIQNHSLNISSLVLHRDGRTYPEEIRGFKQGIDDLIDQGLVNGNIQAGIAEIPKKTSRGLRLVYQNKSGQFENPTVGSYSVLNEREGLVCNTGNPFHMPGTVIPLHARIVYGNLNIEKVLEDIFALSQLTWSAPMRSQRLPMTIKLIDDLLRSVAGTADDDEARYG
ncbi:MAG: hypothetical protein WC112_08050 [Proteiniphilum sp.]